MADEPTAQNTVTPAVRNRSVEQGDVPASLNRRYYVDGRGGAGLGFYVDAKVERPAFRDEGRRLATARTDPNAIRDMALIAQHRGWSIATVRGTAEFRREAWLAGRTLGIEIRGYRPTERDIQELDRRIDRRPEGQARSSRERDQQQDGRRTQGRGVAANDTAAQATLRVVQTVVQARVAEPSAQQRILASARERIAGWLERGARLEPLPMTRRDVDIDRVVTRERTRGH